MKTNLTKQAILEALKNVNDPELGVDIVTLGLIYGVEIKNNEEVAIKMTLTMPGCPFAGFFVKRVETEILAIGAKRATVELVFDPPWKPSDELKAILGV